MAESKKVESQDIISDDLFVENIKQAKLFEVEINKLVLGLKEVNKETTKTLKANKDPKTAEQIKVVTKALDDKKKVDESIIKLEERKAVLAKKIQLLTVEEIKQQTVAKQLAKDRKAELEALAIIESHLIGTQDKLLAQNKLLNIERKRLVETDKDYAVNLARINKAIDENNAKISANSDKLKQNKMNVGNYTDSVREAIDSSNLYSDALGKMNQSSEILVRGFQKLSMQLKGIKESFSSADTFGKKLGTTLKALGIGLLISALASLGALFKSSREGGQQFALIVARISAYISILVGNLSKAGDGILQFGTALKNLFSGDFQEASRNATEATNKISTAFDGTSKRVEEQVKLMVDLTKKTYEYENAIRSLQLTLQKVTLDEEDYNEISADETRTIQERNKALAKASLLRIEGAKIAVDIAKKEKQLAFDAVLSDLKAQQVSESEIERLRKRGAEYLLTDNLINKSTDENIAKLNEKVKAEIDANDKLSDLPRQEAERGRKVLQSETELSIELILKKKLAANSEIQILIKQISDEKQQLSKRALFIKELRDKEIANQQEQFNLFNEGIKKENELNKKGDAQLKQRVDFDSLIAEKDAIKLEERISKLQIAAGQRTLIAKIVKDAQDLEIANNERIKDQEEKEIALKERILKLEKDTLAIQKQVEIDTLKDTQEQKLQLFDEYNTKVLQAENVYNNELLLMRKKAYQDNEELRNQEFELRKQQLIDSANEQKRQTDLSIVQEEEKVKAKEKINTQLDADLKRLELERNKAQRESNKKEVEELRQIEVKKTEIIVNELSKITQNIQQSLDARNQLQNDNNQKQIDSTQKVIERQEQLANEGKANTLADEESFLAKQQLQQKEALEKQAKEKEIIQLTEAYLSALNARLNEPNSDPNSAPLKALGDILIAKGIAKGISGSFIDGTEGDKTLGDMLGRTNTKDGHLILADDDERIFKPEHTKKLKGLTNEEVADIGFKYKNGMLPSLSLNQSQYNDSSSNIYASMLLQTNKQIVSKLDALIAKPHQFIHKDVVGNIVETVTKGNQVTKTTFLPKKRLK